MCRVGAIHKSPENGSREETQK